MKTVWFVFVLAVVSVHGRIAIPDAIRDALRANTLNGEHKHVKVKVIKDNLLDDDELANKTVKTCMTIEVGDDNHITIIDNLPCEEGSKVDNGTALLLTPYIEEGRTDEARNASRVDPQLFLGLESYSGFLTVNKTHNSNTFFWYFPALNPTNDTPWIIWLQGGPGVSSLTGLFNEMGPFTIKSDGVLKRNPYSWVKDHSLVFIENPVGSGYSFTDSPDGFVTDMASYAKNLHSAVKQLVQIFPSLRVTPLYVAGESYAGKYVPALAAEIHRHNNVPGADINLKGVIVGNAYIEPAMISEITRPFLQFSLLEKEQVEAIDPLFEAFREAVKNNSSIEAKKKWNSLVTVLLMLSNQKHAYNFLSDELGIGGFESYLARSDVKRALHVGDIKYSFYNDTVNSRLIPDFLSSTRPLFEELLEHYSVLAYCGQLDQMLPCAVSADVYRQWQWSASDEFRNSTRLPLTIDNKLAGYFKSGGGLTWAVVRGAGHMVPMDVPAVAQQFITHWTHNHSLPTSPVTPTSEILSYFLNSTTVYM